MLLGALVCPSVLRDMHVAVDGSVILDKIRILVEAAGLKNDEQRGFKFAPCAALSCRERERERARELALNTSTPAWSLKI